MESRKDLITKNKSISVLYLVNIISPYRNDFFNELNKYCRLTILCEKRKADNRTWSLNNQPDYKLIYLKSMKISEDTAISFEVIKYLKEYYDIIVIGGYSTPTGMLAIQYLRKIKKGYILNCDGGMIKNESNLKFLFKRYFISNAKSWLSTGYQTDKYLLHYGACLKNIYRYPFTSIMNSELLASPLSNDEKMKLKKQLAIKSKKMVITVGQFIERKGFDLLINVAQYFPNIDFYFIGGVATDSYKELVTALHLENIYFLDFLPKKILLDYYKVSDVMVFPTREDIWGLVINEAMANGIPVISTSKCNAALELIKGNGIIVESDSIDQLKNALSEIFENEGMLNEMSKKSCEIMKDYTVENMAKVHIDIFNDYLTSN